MALIPVGIVEGLQLSSETQINEQGSLELVITTGGGSIEDAFLSNETVEDNKQSYRFYPPNMKTFKGETKSAYDIAKELLRIRDQFITYGSLYGTDKEMTDTFAGVNMFSKTGIEGVDKNIAMLTNPDFVKSVCTTLSTLFLKYLKSKNAFDSGISFRQKFVRQSKDKHFSSIPKPFDKNEVWLEPMTVPKEESKIEYTQYEIDNGLNSGRPVATTKVETSPVDEAKASALFSAGESTDKPDLS